MKCDICKSQMRETFLKKLVGSYVKDKKGKMHAVCSECQRKLHRKQEIITNLS